MRRSLHLMTQLLRYGETDFDKEPTTNKQTDSVALHLLQQLIDDEMVKIFTENFITAFKKFRVCESYIVEASVGFLG